MKMNQKAKGQGVVEYAGAIVIGATVVSLVLLVGPQGIETLFTDLLNAISGFFTTATSTL